MIEVKHLTKMYGNHTAVSDLSFNVEKGQIYGFLGPNGAGKSTTMNIMAGCLGATSGDVKIGGFDIFEESDKAKHLIGYLPEQPPLYQDRTPMEYLKFVGRAKKIPEKELGENIAHVMEVTQISEVSNRLIKNLSKGYKQRIGIAQAILGNPEIIILDEPTVGLDPVQIIEIRDLIKKLGQEHTVILSSHILSEVQAVCQKILIISKGKLVACDTTDNLERLFKGKTGVEFTAEAGPGEIEKILQKSFPEGEIEIKEKSEGKQEVILITDDPDEDNVCRKLFFAFSKAETPILSLKTSKASLEDIFIELTSNEQLENDESDNSKNEREIELSEESEAEGVISENSGELASDIRNREILSKNIENYDTVREVEDHESDI